MSYRARDVHVIITSYYAFTRHYLHLIGLPDFGVGDTIENLVPGMPARVTRRIFLSFPRPLNYTRMRARRKIRLACETTNSHGHKLWCEEVKNVC